MFSAQTSTSTWTVVRYGDNILDATTKTIANSTATEIYPLSTSVAVGVNVSIELPLTCENINRFYGLGNENFLTLTPNPDVAGVGVSPT